MAIQRPWFHTVAFADYPPSPIVPFTREELAEDIAQTAYSALVELYEERRAPVAMRTLMDNLSPGNPEFLRSDVGRLIALGNIEVVEVVRGITPRTLSDPTLAHWDNWRKRIIKWTRQYGDRGGLYLIFREVDSLVKNRGGPSISIRVIPVRPP